jgi:hypothetical protein
MFTLLYLHDLLDELEHQNKAHNFNTIKITPSYPRTKKLVWPHSDLGPPQNTPLFAGRPIFSRAESPKQLGHVTCRC